MVLGWLIGDWLNVQVAASVAWVERLDDDDDDDG